MLLKFIGKDKSLGLRHGKSYNVRISTQSNHIAVNWFDGSRIRCCLYRSPQTFAENWSKP